MILKKDIVTDDKPLLREKSKDVTFPLSEDEKKLLDDMMEYLVYSQDDEKAREYDITPGVGIAAPQVGVLKKMFCVLCEDEKGNEHKYAFVNPKIISYSVTKAYLAGGEGCLSVPEGHKGYVKRSLRIRIKAYDYLTDSTVTLALKGYPAIVVQHEYDHLFGTLYYDRISKENPFEATEEEVAL